MKVQVAWPCAECGKANAVTLSTDEPKEQERLDQCESCGVTTKAGALLQETWNHAVRQRPGSHDLWVQQLANVASAMLDTDPAWLLFDPQKEGPQVCGRCGKLMSLEQTVFWKAAKEDFLIGWCLGCILRSGPEDEETRLDVSMDLLRRLEEGVL